MIEPFDHVRPTSLDDALALVADGGTPYAGGTELLAAMKLGLLAPTRLVDLKSVAALAGVRQAGATIEIGPATPHAVVASDPMVRDHLPVLVDAIRHLGNARVRSQGTIGGNLCFGEPRSDIIPVLVALEARFALRNQRGERWVDAADFFLDAFTVDRNDDEMLVTIVVNTSQLEAQRYERIQHMERPTVGVAIVRRAGTWRVVVGSVGYLPAVRTAPSLDHFDPAEIAEAIEPIEDASGTADYKRHLVRVLVARCIRGAEVSS